MIVHCAYDELVSVAELKKARHPENANKHPPEQVERLAKILNYQGVRIPIVVSTLSGRITRGHGRLLAAIKNRWSEFPVNKQDYESEEQELADLHADNAIASWAELDLAAINAQIGKFGPEFDIDMLGIDKFYVDPNENHEISINQKEDKKPMEVECPNCHEVFQASKHKL